jgi:hypothetical protein
MATSQTYLHIIKKGRKYQAVPEKPGNSSSKEENKVHILQQNCQIFKKTSMDIFL